MSSIGSNGPRKAQGKVLACVNCQQRKKKCDRRSPCSICLKQNTTCVPSTPAPPRRRRQPTKELLERMSRCEELLRQCLEQKAFDKQSQKQQQQQRQSHHIERPGSSSEEGSVSSNGSPDTSTTVTTEDTRETECCKS